MTRAAERREAVTVMTQRGISQRRACVLVDIGDSSLRYRAVRATISTSLNV